MKRSFSTSSPLDRSQLNRRPATINVLETVRWFSLPSSILLSWHPSPPTCRLVFFLPFIFSFFLLGASRFIRPRVLPPSLVLLCDINTKCMTRAPSSRDCNAPPHIWQKAQYTSGLYEFLGTVAHWRTFPSQYRGPIVTAEAEFQTEAEGV